ncbi:indole-3-acetic acid-induced protein arg7 [Phtheirospermum japonicum]|uniref:Indole-3-acetic acid-induced protein arg7 n=1 Tax=Phtheirospermum japonicum TaxID=374723 RepID=A0A830AYK2_9LAMI|nr:indole-3-acetic acid-induced protein arg7 [Phtheirospermum japonicum]
MDSSRKSNKIRDIVRLQQLLKKWKKLANNSNNNNNSGTTTTTTSGSGSGSGSGSKSNISTSASTNSSSAVPKGYVAVCVGKELKRFVIPTEYLGHQIFGVLLREAEEEFGFQQEGVLRFPCEVDLFEKILKKMEDKRSSSSSTSLVALHDHRDDEEERIGFVGDIHDLIINNYSPADTASDHGLMCR